MSLKMTPHPHVPHQAGGFEMVIVLIGVVCVVVIGLLFIQRSGVVAPQLATSNEKPVAAVVTGPERDRWWAENRAVPAVVTGPERDRWWAENRAVPAVITGPERDRWWAENRAVPAVITGPERDRWWLDQ